MGVRNEKQATLQANRAWNKLRYQNLSCEFTATQEAHLLSRYNRILVADNTRQDTQDGQILEQNGLILTLSQPFTYDTLNHTIYLQLYDGTTQAIGIASADASPTYTITLSSAPNLPLSLDDDLYAQTTYVIINNEDDGRSTAFLVDSKSPKDVSIIQVTAINYDARYYQYDLTYKT